MAQDTPKRMVAFSITERDGKTYWSKIGVAFVNRDGSINVNLEALPVSGKLQIREEEDRRERPAGAGDDRGGHGSRRGGYEGRG
jgi:hypothetical protein